jgi:hypothetical protein
MRLSLIDPLLFRDPPQTNEAKTWENAAIPPWRRLKDVAWDGDVTERGISRQAAVLCHPRLPCAETNVCIVPYRTRPNL